MSHTEKVPPKMSLPKCPFQNVPLRTSLCKLFIVARHSSLVFSLQLIINFFCQSSLTSWYNSLITCLPIYVFSLFQKQIDWKIRLLDFFHNLFCIFVEETKWEKKTGGNVKKRVTSDEEQKREKMWKYSVTSDEWQKKGKKLGKWVTNDKKRKKKKFG